MRGRRPKPTVLRTLNGNAGKRPLNQDEPKPPMATEAAPPDWLPEDAGLFWREMEPMLLGARVLTEFDRPALVALAAAWGLWRKSYEYIQEHGSYYSTETEHGGVVVRRHPASIEEAERWKRLRLMLVEFGMTPAGRSRVAMVGEEVDSDDPVARWLDG